VLGWEITIGRPSNLLHVVNNLADWSPACRRHYNGPWLAETGPLTDRERAALERYRWVVAERGFGYGGRWLGRAFGPAADGADAWERARRDLGLDGPEEAALREALDALEARFERLWERDRPRLERQAAELGAALAGAGGVARHRGRRALPRGASASRHNRPADQPRAAPGWRRQ
jgi:hypothetical protein